MKRSLTAISGLGMAILLLSLLFPAPASAGTAKWSAENIPNTIDATLGPAGIDVRDIAAASNGRAIYAVAGDSIAESIIYKSTDTGVRWSTLSTGMAADLVAVAPDDDNFIAIASSSTPAVRVSTNGGTTWYDLGTPRESGSTAAAIYDLAISKSDDGVHYIAAAGKEAGDIANVWYYNASAGAAAWKKTNSVAGFNAASEARAVAFSPNFGEDAALLAVTVSNGASVKLQILTLPSGQWNAISGYPFTLVSDAGISGLDAASLSLAPDYLASEPGQRLAFIGLTISGSASAKSGIYRLDNVTRKELYLGTRIHSLVYNGTNLIAGQYDGNNVYHSSDPLATTPTFSAVATKKAPGGENRVVVARASSTVVAGTSGNESAFAVSGNNGAAFSDISLIDTAITNISDVAVTADGSEVYLVTDDGADLSLWRKASAWQRVLVETGTTGYIVRLGPDSAVYVAKKNAATIYYNDNRGDALWRVRECPLNIRDLAVESDAIAYALNNAGSVSGTRNAGFNWGTVTATGLNSGATIVSIGTDNLLVTSQDGYVAYSTGGNNLWKKIDDRLPSGGKIQVIADDDFATNRLIYAASDTAAQDIWKWKLGSSTAWTDIFRNQVPGGIYGLATDNGTLYALEYNAATGQSTLWECLSPTTATSISVSWGASTTTTQTDTSDTQVHLNATPRALKSSTGKLWAVKTNGTNKLYSLTNILFQVTAREPASGSYIQVNSITGIANDVGFSWARPSNSEATEYEFQLALDTDFNVIITTVTVASEESSVFVMVGPQMTGNASVNFMPGQTYYWRVRITKPLYGQYSEAQSFTVTPVAALVPEPLLPKNGSTITSRTPSFSWEPMSGATGYRFVLDDDADTASPIINATAITTAFEVTEALEYGATYFWKIKALGPVSNDWSAIWTFTVMAEAEAAPPVIIMPNTPSVSTPSPEAPPPTTVTLPTTPAPDVPDYLPIIIVIAAVMLLAVIILIIKLTVRQPLGTLTRLRNRLNELGEGLTYYLRRLYPRRTPGTAGSHTTPVTDQSLSFAAESFLWMTAAGAKGGGTFLLSAEEEQSMGKILASRIQALARDRRLYREFPEDAAAFLHIWSRYGSFEETDRYLTRSFRSKAENVMEFLKCYRGAAPVTAFDRTRYDAVAAVVNPDNVHKAITRLYGHTPANPEAAGSPDRILAARFTYFHQLSRAETGKDGKTPRAGLARANTR